MTVNFVGLYLLMDIAKKLFIQSMGAGHLSEARSYVNLF